MSSGCVVGTSSTTSWLPLCCSSAASFATSAPRCTSLSVAVWSMTRSLNGGTGSTSCANAPPPSKARPPQSVASQRVSQRRMTDLLRCRLLEAHARRHRDLRFVLHREIRLHRIAEHHRRQVGREAAREHVVFGHRLDVAVARDGDAVLGAFELHPQIL